MTSIHNQSFFSGENIHNGIQWKTMIMQNGNPAAMEFTMGLQHHSQQFNPPFGTHRKSNNAIHRNGISQ